MRRPRVFLRLRAGAVVAALQHGARMRAIPWSDLETKGFLHVPGFLSPEELQGNDFATTRVTFGWRQDYESSFVYQNHYDYLNVYIPVIKPVRERSNLCVVPFDALALESPETFRRVVRSGASSVVACGGRQILLRGDVFHRTQDCDTDRVALPVRVSHSKTIVRRSVLADGGLQKAKSMARNPAPYRLIFRAFQEAGRDELPLGELLAARASARGLGGRARLIVRTGTSPRTGSGGQTPSRRSESACC